MILERALSTARRRQVNRYRLHVRALVLLAASCVPSLVHAQQPAATVTSRPETSPFRWAGGPSLRLGGNVRLDLHARAQTDVRVREDTSASGDVFAAGSRRVGVKGELFSRVEFQIEREIQAQDPWRDVFADVRLHRALRIRAGHFKVPFSMERTTSAFDLDFVTRATPVTDLTPGREHGVMVHGRAGRRLFEYEAGLFTHAAAADTALDGGPTEPWKTVAGRITLAPVRDQDGITRDLRVAIGVAQSSLPEGLHATVGHFVSGEAFSEWYFVNGTRTRLGLEGMWNVGPLSLKGELIRVTDTRERQGVTGDDLSDFIVQGGYVSGVWRLAGKAGRSRQAVDVALRFDSLAIGSAGQAEILLPDLRANSVPPLRKDTWTVGFNWLVRRWAKVQINGVREHLVDPLNIRALVPGATWSGLARLQLAV